MKLDFNFVKACKETEVELDGVISALGGRYIGPKTVVTYQNGDVVKYLIEGELGENSIPNKSDAVKVEIGSNVTSIGWQAFKDCFRLSSITIPNSVTKIGDSAFRNCSGLMSITIPDSVTSIDWRAFSGCSGLTSISVSSGNTIYDSRNGCNAIIQTSENILVHGCQNTIIPNNITSIGKRAFSGRSGLTSITIPDSVTSIEWSAFEYCSGLTSITIPDSVTKINGYAFYDCSKLTSITIGNGMTSIAVAVFSACLSLSTIKCLSKNAPIATSGSFGGANTNYTGRNTYSTGNNVLIIPLGATGYDSNAWADPLQDSTKCGFHIEYE